MDHPWSEEREAARLERFKSITLEDVKGARDHIVASPGDIIEIPVEYYDWLISQLEAKKLSSRVLDIIEYVKSGGHLINICTGARTISLEQAQVLIAQLGLGDEKNGTKGRENGRR